MYPCNLCVLLSSPLETSELNTHLHEETATYEDFSVKMVKKGQQLLFILS